MTSITDMKIAGDRRVKHWRVLEDSLQSKPSPDLWDEAVEKFYIVRIKTRYLDPIASIEKRDRKRGEGFAIVALFAPSLSSLRVAKEAIIFVTARRIKSRRTTKTASGKPRATSKTF